MNIVMWGQRGNPGQGGKPWVSPEPLPSYIPWLIKILGHGPVLFHLKRFRGTKCLCGYVWFRLKRLFGTKFTNRRKTPRFIDKNHDV